MDLLVQESDAVKMETRTFNTRSNKKLELLKFRIGISPKISILRKLSLAIDMHDFNGFIEGLIFISA